LLGWIDWMAWCFQANCFQWHLTRLISSGHDQLKSSASPARLARILSKAMSQLLQTASTSTPTFLTEKLSGVGAV
jgi:hypothetical protein